MSTVNLNLISIAVMRPMVAKKSDGISFNHTAGAAFTTETPVIIASAMESTWVSIPFPVLPATNKTHLDLVF